MNTVTDPVRTNARAAGTRWVAPALAFLLVFVKAPASAWVLLALGLPFLSGTFRRRYNRTDPWGILLAWPSLLLVGDVWLGTPSFFRFVLPTIAGLIALGLTVFRPRLLRLARFKSAPRWLVGLVVLLLVAFSFFGTVFIEWGADHLLGQDTAYFTRILYEAANGRAPRADHVGAILYSPPLETHLAAHISPVLYVLAPTLRLVEDWRTLAVLRSLLLLSTLLVGLYWCRRKQLQIPWPFYLLPLTVPALWYQPLQATYLLPIAAPAAAIAFLGAREGRRSWIAIGLLLTMLVREDATMFVGIGAMLVALLSGRARAFTIATAMVGVAWYVFCARVWMPSFSSSSGQAITALFAADGGHAGLLASPEKLMELVFSKETLRSLWVPVRSTGLLALADPVLLGAVPAHGVNILAGGKGFGTLSPTYHYAVLPAVGAALAAFVVLATRTRRSGRMKLPGGTMLPLAPVLVLWLCGAAMSAADAIDSKRLMPVGDVASARQMASAMRELPREWSVAAPQCWLPHLAFQRELFMISHLDEYPDTRQVDAYIVHLDPDIHDLSDHQSERYLTVVQTLEARDDLTVYRDVGTWRILVKKQHMSRTESAE